MNHAMAFHDYGTDYSKPVNRKSALRSIRIKCLDCCCQNAAQVKSCPIPTCSLYPYRLGHNPARTGLGNKHAQPPPRQRP